MYQFPIRIPDGTNLDLTQPFKAPPNTPISQALSIQTTSHLGVDITCGSAQQTWGKECIWPFPWPGTVYYAQVDSPLGATLHAHSQIDTTDPSTGTKYSIIYLHLSSVTQTKTDPDSSVVITYNQGDVIGRIGNNGEVVPAPTPTNPLQGSHLHLGVGVKNPGDLNFVMVDPLIYFDLNDPFRSASTTYQFNNNLSFGTHNPENIQLQKVLQTNGFFPVSQETTDYYGPITASAVLQFRVSKGIPSITDPQGHSVGPLTRQALNSL